MLTPSNRRLWVSNLGGPRPSCIAISYHNLPINHHTANEESCWINPPLLQPINYCRWKSEIVPLARIPPRTCLGNQTATHET